MRDGISRRDLIKGVGGVAIGTLAAGALTGTPIARAHLEDGIDQEIIITMGSMFFQVEGQAKGDPIRVPANKVVRLIFQNPDSILHDAHFGSDPNLEGRYYNNNLVAPLDMLEIPGSSEAWITFTFSDEQKGEYELGCFQLAHYESGMKAPFIIE